MDELKLKRKFAQMMLEGNDPFKSTLLLFPEDEGDGNVNLALRAAVEWPDDKDVLKFKEGILEEKGKLSFLPDKVKYALAIWDLAKDCNFPEDRIKALKLYGDTMGFIEKPKTTINTNVNSNNSRVMVVKDGGSDENWAAKLEKQQESLTNNTVN